MLIPSDRDEAASKLGLDFDTSSNLFYPDHDDYDSITPQQAGRTLRHLAATGEVDWTV